MTSTRKPLGFFNPLHLRRAVLTMALGLGSALSPVLASTLAQGQAPSASAASSLKVLMVLSSAGRDQGKTRPGYELDEFAQAYLIFKANGLAVEVASPEGGQPEPDKYKPNDEHIAALNADPAAQALLQNTRRIADVKPGEHGAIFVVGGKGAMFDLASDAKLAELIAAQLQRGDPVGAVCHGVSALAAAKLANGQPLVAGKRVTGFTDEEEREFGKRWSSGFPFLIEQRLREQGARWEEAGILRPNVVVDGNLVTGQNPFSTPGSAQALVRLMGRTPVARQASADEATMELADRFAKGDREALKAAVRDEPKRYKLELLGYLAHVQARDAKTDSERRAGLDLMLSLEPAVGALQMQLAIADALAKLGDKAAARQRLLALIEREPKFEPAKKLLDNLGDKI